MSDRVLVDVQDHVAHVRLNRPDKRNGLDIPMFEGIIAAGQRVASDPSVRVVLLSGEGKAFCAGLDWGAFMAMGAEAGERLLNREGSVANIAQRVTWIWQEVPVPVIAVVHGPTFGGGLQIALGADIRYASADAQLSAMEIRYGLVPDMGLTQTLLKIVRPDVARELVFTARIVGAEEAKQLGLVTRVCADPMAEARSLAIDIAGRSPDAIRACKRLLKEAPFLDVAASFKLETELQLGLLGKPNQLEAVRSVMTKTTPEFKDPS